MKIVKVLGPGCKRCVATAEMVQHEAERLGVPVSIEKVTDYAAIAGYDIASTLGDRVPEYARPKDVEQWSTRFICRSLDLI
jgi:hypothetical protein